MFMQQLVKEDYSLQDFKIEMANPSQVIVANIKNQFGELDVEVDTNSIEFSNKWIHGRFSLLEKFPSFIESPALVSKDNYVEDVVSAICFAMFEVKGAEMTESRASIKEAFGASFSPFAELIVGEQTRFYVKMDKTKIQFVLELETDGAAISLTILNLKAQEEPMVH